LDPKKCPTQPFTWRRKVLNKGLRTTINESIVTKNLTKRPHPSSLLERMGGAIN